MLQNARRDGAEFAWVPMGDTCAFCLTLASRGWQRQSRKARDRHASHIHANCDCEYCVRFDSRSTVEGYDPDALLEQYYAAEGNTPQEKINAMRRAHYAENAPTIRAQKRAAYAARKEREQGLLYGGGHGTIQAENSVFRKTGTFNSKADPMADVFGPGVFSHPEEIGAFREECEASGVEIIHREKESLQYEPGPVRGKPGQLVVNEDASYSAWCHEMQHMRDDRDHGWDGAVAVWDRKEHYKREQKAYEIEIQLALSAGREDIADLLRANLEEERVRIYAAT